MSKNRIFASLVVALLLTGSAAAQAPQGCAQELRQLRWLVQKYGSERTALEFALAASEATRQAADARLKALEAAIQALESARGQKGGSQ